MSAGICSTRLAAIVFLTAVLGMGSWASHALSTQSGGANSKAQKSSENTSDHSPRGPLGSMRNPIKFYFLPSAEIQMIQDRAKLIRVHLQKDTGLHFRTLIPNSYIAIVEAFGTGRVDMAALNTFGYLLAHEKYGANAVLRSIRSGLPTYRGALIVRADSGIQQLKDVHGKKVAYVDPASVSGHLLPAKLFKDNGIVPSSTVFANRHDAAVSMVYQRQADVAATFYTQPDAQGQIHDGRKLIKAQYPDVESVLRILLLTEPVMNDPIVMGKTMSPELREKIVQSLLKFVKTEQGREAFFSLYAISGLERAQDSEYDPIRKMLLTLDQKAENFVK